MKVDRTNIPGSFRSTQRLIIYLYAHSLFLLGCTVFLTASLTTLAGAQLALIISLGQLTITLILVRLGIKIIRVEPDTIWTPLPWLPLCSGIFYGFGPLVEIWGSEATRTWLAQQPTSLNLALLARVNTIVTFGVTMLLLGILIHMLYRSSSWNRTIPKPSYDTQPTFSVETVTFTFLIGGGLFRYLVLIPASWGVIDLTIPGALSNLGALVDVGFGLAAYLAVQKGGRWTLFMIFFWPINFGVTVLSFSKTDSIVALLLPILGGYIARRSFFRLCFGFCLIIFTFIQLQPFIHYGRAKIFMQTGTIYDASLGNRLEIARDYFWLNRSESSSISANDRQGWWTRLNYAGAQAFAVEQYDSGFYGQTLSDIPLLFVPRMLWPGKPIIWSPGLMYYNLVTGNEGTSFLGLSIYGDLYWNFGWWGVFLGPLLIGYIFGMISRRSLMAIRRREFFLLPTVLIALKMAMIGTTDFVITLIGSLPIYTIYWIMFMTIINHTRHHRIRY